MMPPRIGELTIVVWKLWDGAWFISSQIAVLLHREKAAHFTQSLVRTIMVLSADVYMPNGLYLLAWSSQQKLLNRLNNERLVFEFFDKNHIVTVFVRSAARLAAGTSEIQ